MRREISAYNTVDVSVECQVGYRMLPCAGYGRSTAVLTYEPPLALLRTPFGSYESSSEGHGVRVWSSVVAKVFCLGEPGGQEVGTAPVGP